MLLNSNILPIIIAGLMNASFIIPAKYIKNIISEKIWLYHSVIGFSIVPWLILASTNPNNFQNYLFLQPTVLLFLLGGGIIFGLGQVCFAYALEFIGVALSFTINL